jgi:hypothetical protein
MDKHKELILLVGDNPFHGISHLSQEQARNRGNYATSVDNAAQLVLTALDSGSDGFMFSVSETTLSILDIIRKTAPNQSLKLYALVPYAFEYVRLATQLGGIPGLAKRLSKQILFSGNISAIAAGIKGVLFTDLSSVLKTYLLYEISRIKSSSGKKAILESMLLQEVITDMALALDLEWIFKSFIDFSLKRGIKPGFETRNFQYLVDKFESWNIDLSKIIIATPFNTIGFLMNPSKRVCEEVLAKHPEANIIAMSILAAGYLKPGEAFTYLQSVPNINTAVIGVSKLQQAKETFKLKYLEQGHVGTNASK